MANKKDYMIAGTNREGGRLIRNKMFNFFKYLSWFIVLLGVIMLFATSFGIVIIIFGLICVWLMKWLRNYHNDRN